jgi:hypothetical protein
LQYGFHLFIDEAGDEGIERVRPVDAGGASEYFVMCGILIRAHRHNEMAAFLNSTKAKIGMAHDCELHFRDLGFEEQKVVISELAKFQFGTIAVVSNKRNMRRYRNVRIEQKEFEIVRGGRRRAKQYNWFYNHTFRYLLERASFECARWGQKVYGSQLPIRIVFSQRKGFRYSQTQAYLHKLRVARHGPGYFNNKGTIDWSVVNPSNVESARAKNEPGLQFADCVASAVYKAIDQDWFGEVTPSFIEALAPRFIRQGMSPRDYGFKRACQNFRVRAGCIRPA